MILFSQDIWGEISLLYSLSFKLTPFHISKPSHIKIWINISPYCFCQVIIVIIKLISLFHTYNHVLPHAFYKCVKLPHHHFMVPFFRLICGWGAYFNNVPWFFKTVTKGGAPSLISRKLLYSLILQKEFLRIKSGWHFCQNH